MKKKFTIKGMHCKSCETLLVDELEEREGVIAANASHKNEELFLNFDESIFMLKDLKAIVNELGYKLND